MHQRAQPPLSVVNGRLRQVMNKGMDLHEPAREVVLNAISLHSFIEGGTFLTMVAPKRSLEGMSLPPGVVSGPFHVGAKGRVVLPAAVRRAAGIEEGDQVVARPAGEGRVVIETVRSIRERVWAAAPDASGLDSTMEIRTMRDEDNNLSDTAFKRRAIVSGSETDSAAAGAALLARLGL